MKKFLTLCCLASLAAPAMAQPTVPFQVATLPGSDARLYAEQDGRLPRVWVDLHLEAGERFVPKELAGMSMLAALLLDKGPAEVPYARFRHELFLRNVAIDWEADNRFLTAHVKCRPDELVWATRLVRDTAAHPRSDATTFKQVHDEAVNQRRALNDNMSAVTFLYNKQRLWGFAPEMRLAQGWTSTLEGVTAADLKGYLNREFAHPGAFLSAVGPDPASKLAAAIAPTLAGWLGPFSPTRTAEPPTPSDRAAVLIDKPGATNAQVYLLGPLDVDLTSREAAAAEVFFAGMGDGLDARLGKTLRVERGLTYYAGSGFRRMEWPGWYVYSYGGLTQTPKLLSGFYEIFEDAKDGLAPAEVAEAKDLLLKQQAQAMETPAEQMAAVADAVGQGLPADTPFTRPKLLAQVTPADVQAVGAKLATLSGASIVVMGDASKLEAPIEKALPQGTRLEVRKMTDLVDDATR
ncbi:MAG TPA: insulinase family protein [Oscillatoriaceae cyanobacterium]